MHSRRLACLLLGMWLAGSFLMTWLTPDSAPAIDELMANHNAAAGSRLKTLGAADARGLLRYAAEERNRDQVRLWEEIQLVFGCGFFLYLLFGTAEGKFPLGLALGMLLIVAAQHFLFSPELVAAGRLADFLPDAGEAHRKAQVVRNATTGIEVFKWLVGAALAVALISYQPRRSRNAAEKIDLVNKGNYRHVDG